jgi:uncharacterized protein YndB with AHSA1/START domain
MSLAHADFIIERRYGATPQQTFSAFSDPELERQRFADPGNWLAGREHGTGKLLDALERFLAGEQVR